MKAGATAAGKRGVATRGRRGKRKRNQVEEEEGEGGEGCEGGGEEIVRLLRRLIQVGNANFLPNQQNAVFFGMITTVSVSTMQQLGIIISILLIMKLSSPPPLVGQELQSLLSVFALSGAEASRYQLVQALLRTARTETTTASSSSSSSSSSLALGEDTR